MQPVLGVTRSAIVGLMLLGGTLGVFGDVKSALLNHAGPRMPRTEQEQMSRSRTDRMMPVVTEGQPIVARRRSGEGDPGIPDDSTSFRVGGPVMC